MQSPSKHGVLCDCPGHTSCSQPHQESPCTGRRLGVKAGTRPCEQSSRGGHLAALFQLLTHNFSKLPLSSLNFELQKVYFTVSEVLHVNWGVSWGRQCHFFLTLLQTFIYSSAGKLGCSAHWAFSCAQVKSLSSFYILHFVPLWTCWKIVKESWKVPLAPKNSADYEAERGNSGFIQC